MSAPDAVCHVIGAWNADEPERLPYRCRIHGYWNGWAIPSLGHAEMDRFIQDMNTGPEIDRLFWHGNLLAHQRYDETIADLTHPDTDGRYLLDFGWCFHEVSPPEPGASLKLREGMTSILLPASQRHPSGTIQHSAGARPIGTTRLDSTGRVRAHKNWGPISNVRRDFDTLHEALNELARLSHCPHLVLPPRPSHD